jgi:hypothetical protein
MAPISRVGAPSPRGLPLERDIHHLGGFSVLFFSSCFQCCLFWGPCQMFCVAASYSVFYRLNPFIVAFRGTCVEQTSGVPKFSWGLCVGLCVGLWV